MRNITAAIEFGTSKVICIIGRARSIGRFEVLSSGVAKYEGIKGGRWQKPENIEDAAAKALYIAEKKARKRVKEAYISVPGVFCKVVCQEGYASVHSGYVTDDDVERFMQSAEEMYDDPKHKIISGMPVYFMLDDGARYIDVVGSRTSQLSGKASFILARKQYMEDVTQILGSAGVKVKGFIPEILAESLFLVPPEERDASAVLLDVGFYDTNVSVVYGDAVVYNRTIHAGGMQIMNDLSLILSIDLDMAEQVKKQYCFGLENTGTKLYDYARPKDGRVEKFSHSLVTEVIEARVEQLCEFISEAFEHSPISIARRTRIFLSGGGLAMIKGARDMLEQQLKRQVRVTKIEAPQLSTPNYYTALALLDYVFEGEYFSEKRGVKSVLKRLSDKLYD